MALADYCQCEKCGGKTFYDANTHWWEDTMVGTVKALCSDCIKGWDIVLVQRESPQQQKLGH